MDTPCPNPAFDFFANALFSFIGQCRFQDSTTWGYFHPSRGAPPAL